MSISIFLSHNISIKSKNGERKHHLLIVCIVLIISVCPSAVQIGSYFELLKLIVMLLNILLSEAGAAKGNDHVNPILKWITNHAFEFYLKSLSMCLNIVTSYHLGYTNEKIQGLCDVKSLTYFSKVPTTEIIHKLDIMYLISSGLHTL